MLANVPTSPANPDGNVVNDLAHVQVEEGHDAELHQPVPAELANELLRLVVNPVRRTVEVIARCGLDLGPEARSSWR